jgi:hypothetical protein
MLLLPTQGVIPCITDSYIVCEDRLWRINHPDKLRRTNQPDRLWRMNQTNKALQAAVVEVLVVVAAVELTEEARVATVAPAEVDVIQQTLNVDLSSQGMFTF